MMSFYRPVVTPKMKGTLWFVISLLIMISGVLTVGCQEQSANPPPAIPVLPFENPIIEMHTSTTMAGVGRHLTIDEDGSIVYIEEEGLRFPQMEAPIRTTRAGQLQEDELNHLLELVDKCPFDSEGKCNACTEIIDTDADSVLSIHCQKMTRTIMANYQPLFHLFHPKVSELSDVPEPVRKLYQELKHIIDDRTTQVAKEKIPVSE